MQKWKQLGKDIDGEADDDQSGYSVSLSADGKTVAIGAPYNNGDDTSNSNRGHVRVHRINEYGNWTQIGQDIDGEARKDNSGYSVSLSADGNTVAIGAHLNNGDDTSNSNRGHVSVHKFVNDNWTQIGEDIDGEAVDDQSGYSVSLSADGKRVAIGARRNDGDDTFNSNRGHVRIYELKRKINKLDKQPVLKEAGCILQ